MRWLIGAALAALWLTAFELVPLRGTAGAEDLLWLGAATLVACLVFLVVPLFVALLVGATPLGRGLGAALGRRPWLRRGLGVALIVAGTVAHHLDATLYVRLYLSLHLVLGVVALALVAAGFATLLPPWRARALGALTRWVLLLIVLAGGTFGAGLALARVVEAPHRRYLAVERTTLLGHGLLLLHDRFGILATDGLDDHVMQALVAGELSPQVRTRTFSKPRRANVLWITVDSMRADSVPSGGAMARLAAEGVSFRRAYAPSCWTIHSMTATFTSRLVGQLAFTPVSVSPDLVMTRRAPDDALVTDPSNWKKVTPVPIDEQTPTLAELLGAAGWQTVTPIAYLFYLPVAGVVRGFQTVDERPLREHNLDNQGLTSAALTDGALGFLAARDPARPFFMWIHYMDPHAPYVGHGVAQGGSDRARYEAELGVVDAELGRLLADLERRGLLDDTIVVLHADHGEEFREHGGQYHATTVYDEQVHVPFVIRAPKAFGFAPGVREEPVSLLDAMPTVLELVGVGAGTPILSPAALLDVGVGVRTTGRTLAGALASGAEPPKALIYSDCTRFGRSKRAVINWPRKAILDRATSTVEIYDLATDPGETRNIASERTLRRFESILDYMP